MTREKLFFSLFFSFVLSYYCYILFSLLLSLLLFFFFGTKTLINLKWWNQPFRMPSTHAGNTSDGATCFDLAFDWLTALREFFVDQPQRVEHVLSSASARKKGRHDYLDLSFNWLTGSWIFRWTITRRSSKWKKWPKELHNCVQVSIQCVSNGNWFCVCVQFPECCSMDGH